MSFNKELLKHLVQHRKFDAIQEYLTIQFPNNDHVIVTEYDGSNARLFKQNKDIVLMIPREMDYVQENVLTDAIEKGTIFDDAETVDNSVKYLTMVELPHNGMMNKGFDEPKHLQHAIGSVIGKINDAGRFGHEDADIKNGQNFLHDMVDHGLDSESSVAKIVDDYLGSKKYEKLPLSYRKDVAGVYDEIDNIKEITPEDCVTDNDYALLDMEHLDDDHFDECDDVEECGTVDAVDECDNVKTVEEGGFRELGNPERRIEGFGRDRLQRSANKGPYDDSERPSEYNGMELPRLRSNDDTDVVKSKLRMIKNGRFNEEDDISSDISDTNDTVDAFDEVDDMTADTPDPPEASASYNESDNLVIYDKLDWYDDEEMLERMRELIHECFKFSKKVGWLTTEGIEELENGNVDFFASSHLISDGNAFFKKYYDTLQSIAWEDGIDKAIMFLQEKYKTFSSEKVKTVSYNESDSTEKIFQQGDFDKYIKHESVNQEGFFSKKPKKLKPIPRDIIAYITVEMNAIEDSNDQAMISGYTCSKLELVDFYLNCIDTQDDRYIVPHSRQYLVQMQNDLNNLLAKILKIKPINRNDRLWKVNVTYPDGWRG